MRQNICGICLPRRREVLRPFGKPRNNIHLLSTPSAARSGGVPEAVPEVHF